MENAYIVFSDLKGFSLLSESESIHYCDNVLPGMSAALRDVLSRTLVRNTWGDAILAVFKDGNDAVDYAVRLRDFFSVFDFKGAGYKLSPRIAGHFGAFRTFQDQLIGSLNIIGQNVNAAARLEPVTKAGSVYVSNVFRDAYLRQPGHSDEFVFDDIGEMLLAKKFGKMDVCLLRRKGEVEQHLTRIASMDFSLALPEPESISLKEQALLDDLASSKSERTCKVLIGDIINDKMSGDALIVVAERCKDIGLYDEALKIIRDVEAITLSFNEVGILPFQFYPRLIKVKANCLTRLGRYGEAAQELYNLWRSGCDDVDALCMLAAQYKRMAIFQHGGAINSDNINMELLKKSRDIYLHAFGLNSDDYYPVINAAYLCKILDLEDLSGPKLAEYVSSSWNIEDATDW